MINYYGPKPANRGMAFGPAYGERQPGWGGAPDPTVVNPGRPGPPVAAPAWPAESWPPAGGGVGPGRFASPSWPGMPVRQPDLFDQARFGAAGPYGEWGFGPRQPGWGGQAGGWAGFDRLVR